MKNITRSLTGPSYNTLEDSVQSDLLPYKGR